MIPPRNAMSEPARIGTCRSATALVREKRGSTWMIVAPRRFASITQRNPTGWHSAMLEPWMTMQSAFCRSCWNVVAPPRPNEIPRPGTVELCHMRAWFSTCTMPERGEQLLDEVVFFVVERGAAEMRDRQRAIDRLPFVTFLLPVRVARALHALGDHVHRRLERQLGPLGPVRLAIEHAIRAMVPGDQLVGRRALGTKAPFADRRFGIAFDVGDPLILHVDQLPATDGAIGADRSHDPIRALRARAQRARPR